MDDGRLDDRAKRSVRALHEPPPGEGAHGAASALDETRLQVFGEPGPANTALSHMWVACGGPPEAPVILYHYASSRGTEVAIEMPGNSKATFRPMDTRSTTERVTARKSTLCDRGHISMRSAKQTHYRTGNIA